MVSYWSFSDTKSPQVSRILLIILIDLNNTVVWMVSTCLLSSKSSSPLINTLGIFQVHQLQLVLPSPLFCTVFFSSLAKSLFLLSFDSILWPTGTAKFGRFSSIIIIISSSSSNSNNSLRIFRNSSNWCNFSGIWVTESLHSLPVFEPIFTVLEFECLFV